MTNNGWRSAREKSDLSHVRVHDLRHTFATRLRAAGVDRETRAELLGHRSGTGNITTHYSAAQLNELINAVDKLCSREYESSTILMLKRKHV
jgi:integrase